MPIENLSLAPQPEKRRRPYLTAILLAVSVGAVATGYAMGQASSLDADGDGMVTYDELAAVMPEMTQDSFVVLDINADGALDASELAAAQEAGLIPAG